MNLPAKRKIVIVGGAGRLGKVFVKECKSNDMDVYVLDICDRKKWDSLKIDCNLFFQINQDSDSLSTAIKQIKKHALTIDCVINTSYPKNQNYGKPFFKISSNDFNENIVLHVGGYFNVMQKFSEFFLHQGYGNIINIASIQGVLAPKFEHYSGTKMTSPVEYSASKSAIISMSKYLAKFLSGKNIRVNCISPGGIKDKQPQMFIDKYALSCTSKGLLNPEDLIGTLLFLISDQSKFINGQNIIVDDGWSL